MEPFYQATLIFSESKLPTTNQKDLILAEIKEHLESKANDSILSVAVDAMMEKFESLFNDDKVLITSLAPFIDPRLRNNENSAFSTNEDLLKIFKERFNKIYSNLSTHLSKEIPSKELNAPKTGFFWKKKSGMLSLYHVITEV